MRFGRRMLWSGAIGGGVYWLMRYFRPRHSTLVLNDKVVVITGASSGIGRALAFGFARRAARVVLVARRTDRLEAVRREIEPYTTDVLVIPADVTDEAQLQHVADRTLEEFGRIDVLVNNAGVFHGGLLQDQNPEHIRQELDVNLWAAIRLTQLVLPHMLAHRHGFIMNVGSGLSRLPVPLFSPYAASKYGLRGFSETLRRELYGTGVHITLVLPGWTHTDLLNPDVEDLVARYGCRVEHPDAVAERAILALVHGEDEILLGGPMERFGAWLERCAPVVMRLYWRLRMTPEWIITMSKVGK